MTNSGVLVAVVGPPGASVAQPYDVLGKAAEHRVAALGGCGGLAAFALAGGYLLRCP